MQKRWAKLAIRVLLICLLHSIFPSVLHAAATDTYYVTLSYPSDSETAAGTFGYYSRKSSLMPDSVDFASLGIDTSKVLSATLIENGGAGEAKCDNTHCWFDSPIAGMKKSVSAMHDPVEGYFDWWRNQPGYHGYWWSYDLNGGTHYADPPTGTCGSTPCEYPGGTYTDIWEVDGSNLRYSDDDNEFNINFSYINLEDAIIDPGGSVISIDSTSVDPDSGVVSFSSTDGPFDPGYFDTLLGSDPLGRRWSYSYTATFKGSTYYYPHSWILTIQNKDSNDPDPDTPDLVAVRFVNIEPICYGGDIPIKFRFDYLNRYKDIDQEFSITVWDNKGNLIKTEKRSGMKKDETGSLYFEYIFPDASPVTFRGVVDS